MADIDCWRLLGISPPATADEVRAAFAKRARDVHPDSGGTGDSLTMSLLVDAREEALAQAKEGGRSSRRAETGRAAGTAGSGPPSGTCHVCRQTFPPNRLYENRIYRGFRGRPKAGRVLMCIACACQIEADYAQRKRKHATYAIATVLLTTLVAVVALALHYA
jgi:hypothetical protein